MVDAAIAVMRNRSTNSRARSAPTTISTRTKARQE
jgi:hypothetical protein